ncbi:MULTISPECIES: hypothetical protein [Bradyrhizobium]|uniref:hypothetical protein n=1 Tax=Bradyrhizobium TaxID=374 RepID=UPI0004B82B31|nr:MULTISPECIES: hypothetical protein [unclassified Bradyrhizobium]
MITTVKVAAQIAWAVSIIGVCVAIGGDYGWTHHAWPGAIALGTVGFCIGAALAASPPAFLELLHGGF